MNKEESVDDPLSIYPDNEIKKEDLYTIIGLTLRRLKLNLIIMLMKMNQTITMITQ